MSNDIARSYSGDGGIGADAFGYTCDHCGEWVNSSEVFHYCRPETSTTFVWSWPPIQKEKEEMKLSEEEKNELHRIKEDIQASIKGDIIDRKFAYDLGWLMGIIDRLSK